MAVAVGFGWLTLASSRGARSTTLEPTTEMQLAEVVAPRLHPRLPSPFEPLGGHHIYPKKLYYGTDIYDSIIVPVDVGTHPLDIAPRPRPVRDRGDIYRDFTDGLVERVDS